MARYIDQVAGRVDGSGGNAARIPPSLHGAPTSHGGRGQHEDHDHDRRHYRDHDEDCGIYEGKISGLVFDQFGDFDGFVLRDDDDYWRFHSRERDMRELVERAWRERLRVKVMADVDDDLRLPRTVILTEPPR